MRWILLLGLTTCCIARESRPPAIIPLGTSPEELAIYDASSRPAYLTSSDAALIGVVISSSAQVHQSAAKILLEEACTLRIEAMYGRIAKLAGATTARLDTSFEQDKYQQLEPDWSTYGHLKKGQRVVVLLYDDEGGPEMGRHGLIVINEDAKTLPDILRRTGSDASRFTAADLVVLKAASPLFHGEVVAVAEIMAEMRNDEAAFLNRLVGVCVALFFGFILCADHIRRQQAPPQKPTT